MKSKSTTLKIIVFVVLLMLTCVYHLADLRDDHQLAEDAAGDHPTDLPGASQRSRNSRITPLHCSAAGIS